MTPDYKKRAKAKLAANGVATLTPNVTAQELIELVNCNGLDPADVRITAFGSPLTICGSRRLRESA